MSKPYLIPTFLLPKSESVDYNKWAVVACDQHTSNKKYWQELENIVGDSYSTLNLILPEVYLNDDNSQERIDNIYKSMSKYIDDDIFTEVNGYVFVKRIDSTGKTRRGLIMLIDLEEYSYIDTDKSLIRSSEGTVLERIPPRVKIRENCLLEFPHIMLLCDDKNNLIENAIDKTIKTLLYDFDLNMKGGHIEGYLLKSSKNESNIDNALNELFLEQKNKTDKPLLFAVGDGNHSLAAAKQCWENEKKTVNPNQNARYALVELVNIYDNGLDFEPIHRVLFNVTNIEVIKQNFLDFLDKKNQEHKSTVKNKISLVLGSKTLDIQINFGAVEAVAYTDEFLSLVTKQDKNSYIDYIHGKSEVVNMCNNNKNLGFLLPNMDKKEFFAYINTKGSLPRKTFSMGEAEDKRYYLEGRKIK